MEKLPLPESFKSKPLDNNQSEIVIEPCYPGYGNTIGNALRRVLFSSLPGAAITSVKIKDVTHEFATIPGVKEDVVEIIMNLKRLNFVLHGTDEVKASLKVKGAKKVKAKDLKITSDTALGNPEELIATLTDKDAEFEIEITIKTGRGYVPVENIEKKQIQLGTIAIDSIYTPVVNVNFTVENVRVGQMTNYDKLLIQITTDGTITPEEALKSSASILVDHFSAVAMFGDNKKVKIDKADKVEESDVLRANNNEEEDEDERSKADDKAVDSKVKKKRGRPKKSDK